MNKLTLVSLLDRSLVRAGDIDVGTAVNISIITDHPPIYEFIKIIK
jgi:hypothetical protein